MSRMARRPSTNAAPAIAPAAAAVTPSTNAFTRGSCDGAAEVARRDDDEEIARQEDAEGGDGPAERARDEVADEGDGDDDRSRRDHRDRDGVEELALGEPLELVHDGAVEERHDREAASEDERAGLGEAGRDLPERRRRRGAVEPGEEPRPRHNGERRRLRRARSSPAGRRRRRGRRARRARTRSTPVTIALTRKSVQSSGSFPSVLFASL